MLPTSGRGRSMAGSLRIGLLHTDGDLAQSIREQVLGAELAARYTKEITGAEPTLVRRPVASAGDIPRAADELVSGEGCQMLLGALNVPHSIRTAEWCEEHRIVYATANNNPLVGSGRRHVFHIGVPSEITGDAIARFLIGERGAKRIGLLHAGNEFQVHAAGCTASSFTKQGAEVQQLALDDSGAADAATLEQLKAWRPDAVMIYDSEAHRQVRLTRLAHDIGGFPPFVHARGMLCREFRDGAGSAAEGHFFVDMFLRSATAPAEEQALHRFLAAAEPDAMATASHCFGWDELRLLATAWGAAGPHADNQIAYLESLRSYPGAGGPLTFTERDHNGRWSQDPTTIAELVNGQFVVVSTLSR
jgi:ABC-type branched-subunit amino acid transport system substrate-binding protein